MWRQRLIRFVLVAGVAILILLGVKALTTTWREKPPALPKIKKVQIKQIEPLKEKVLGTSKIEGQAGDLLEQIKKFPEEQIKAIKKKFDQQFWEKFIEVENEQD